MDAALLFPWKTQLVITGEEATSRTPPPALFVNTQLAITAALCASDTAGSVLLTKVQSEIVGLASSTATAEPAGDVNTKPSTTVRPSSVWDCPLKKNVPVMRVGFVAGFRWPREVSVPLNPPYHCE